MNLLDKVKSEGFKRPFGFGHKTYRLPLFCHSRPHQDHRPKGGNPGGEKFVKFYMGCRSKATAIQLGD
jgi:hypothetical protein